MSWRGETAPPGDVASMIPLVLKPPLGTAPSGITNPRFRGSDYNSTFEYWVYMRFAATIQAENYIYFNVAYMDAGGTHLCESFS